MPTRGWSSAYWSDSLRYVCACARTRGFSCRAGRRSIRLVFLLVCYLAGVISAEACNCCIQVTSGAMSAITARLTRTVKGGYISPDICSQGILVLMFVVNPLHLLYITIHTGSPPAQVCKGVPFLNCSTCRNGLSKRIFRGNILGV